MNKVKDKKLIVIVGPTGIGKTDLSIYLAKELNCEIISADSRQFYRQMSIGTAKPSNEELKCIKHHFIDCMDIEKEYSAGKFESDAIKIINELFLKNNHLIMVGGSGMYIDAVCNGIDDIPSDLDIRAQLKKELKENGILHLQNELLKKDPNHYHAMDINNPQRLIRALEVCRCSGRTYTSFRSNPKKQREFHIIKIGLEANRTMIYERINKRVDKMIEDGLIDEAKSLYENRHLNALNTVGYKELFNYFQNKLSLEESVEEIKKNTRRFAKRQLTWFKKDENINWFSYDERSTILSFIKN